MHFALLRALIRNVYHTFSLQMSCVRTAALLYIHSDIYLQNIYWVRWLCASSFNDSRVLCVFLCCVRHYQVPLGNRTAHTYVFIHNSCDAAFSYSMTEPMMVCALCIIICVLCVIFVFALYLDAQRLILNHISPTLPTHTHTRAHMRLYLFSLCLSLFLIALCWSHSFCTSLQCWRFFKKKDLTICDRLSHQHKCVHFNMCACTQIVNILLLAKCFVNNYNKTECDSFYAAKLSRISDYNIVV